MRPLVLRNAVGVPYAVPTEPRRPAKRPPRQYTSSHASTPESTPAHRLGQGRGMAKLTDDEVRAIRADYAEGKWTVADLAYIYRVSKGTIRGVIRGTSYTHIADDA